MYRQEIEMNIPQAINTFRYFGRERASAYRSNMDWSPDAASRKEMREAAEIIARSKRAPERLLNKSALELYYDVQTE
jgi:hypothetical protein